MRQRIGILGGSFNPIHNGHLHLAEVAKEKFNLNHIIFVPAKISPFKQNAENVVDGVHRLKMCRLAVENNPDFSVSDFELNQDAVSYTLYTVEYFKEIFPDSELVLLVGSDMLLRFDKWYQWREILKIVSLGVVARDIQDMQRLNEKNKSLSQYGKIDVFCDDIILLSSTKVRDLIKKNKDFSCYLPKKVVQYILFHKLYEV